MSMQSIRFSRIVAGAAIALAVAAGLAPAQAQGEAADYPNKPIRLIVPFAAGGGNDIFARLIGAKVSEYLGQQLVIENRPAAGGRPSASFVINQPADGYTLFIAASGVMSVASAVYPKLAYHPTKDFTPLTMIANFPLIVVGQVQNPAKTVAELVAYAKANPDKANYGTTSPAFIISTELLKLKTGMPGVGIPLKSSAEMILCVMQQNCLLAISDGPPAIPQIKSGKVRALAVTGAERSPELPNVPSMAEAGYPEVNTKLWSGFFVSAKTPRPIAAKLEAALRRAIADPGVKAKLKEMAVTPGGGTGEEFRKMIDADIQNYVSVVKAANLKFE
ncbi:MAG: tripartite tricarboxylate transporter substrate binding protein [Rhizobiales bacterium]|nr:tripartite tricarboxylate transporter substrate binding protein [Hyphomicrobiales bacterium]